jgi:natural product biosynthesis luciferase-like monooxygenase protein
MADLEMLARRLAALSPEQRRRLEAEMTQRGIELPTELRSSASAEHETEDTGSTDLSVFFFSAEQPPDRTERGGYRMLLEAAEIADSRGFEAVWTPERHFHAFGGPYPAPALLAAALAARTKHVHVRAGSLVLPLHDPIRVAEEWAVVDNLSGGRAGVAFASGFHPLDFVFAPEDFERRREVLREHLDTVRLLWRGEAVRRRTGTGEAAIRTYPRPVQPELPVWLTASGDSDRTFELAGTLGLNLLTALLNQNVDQLARRIGLYRKVLAEHGHDPSTRRVTVMLHAYVGTDEDEVLETVRMPLYEYMRTHLGLARSLAAEMGVTQDLTDYDAHEAELLEFGFQRYVERASLIGTPETCRKMIRRLEAVGVNEVAGLIDFGIPDDRVLAGVERMADLRGRR